MKAIRIYAVFMWLIAVCLIVCTIMVQREHHINSPWILYVLAAVAVWAGILCWWAGKKPEPAPVFDSILKASNSTMYHVNEQPIEAGDLIYNIYTMNIDKCYKVNNNGTISVQVLGTPYLKVFVTNRKYYRKAIRV